MRSRRIARDARRIPDHVEFPAAALRKLRTLQRVSARDFRPIRRRCASRDLYIFRSASLRYTQSGLTRSAYDECSPPQTLARAGFMLRSGLLANGHLSGLFPRSNFRTCARARTQFPVCQPRLPAARGERPHAVDRELGIYDEWSPASGVYTGGRGFLPQRRSALFFTRIRERGNEPSGRFPTPTGVAAAGCWQLPTDSQDQSISGRSAGGGRECGNEIGRASCRERGSISVVAVSLKK